MTVLGNNYTTTSQPKTSDGRRAFGTGNYSVYKANGTFTVPCGVTQAKVHVYGAGGGGGFVGGGGAGGGYGSCTLTVTPGCVCNIVVGLGGAAGANSASSIGANGSLSCFGTIIGCGGQGGCSYICNPACVTVAAANGGFAVGTTASKGGNGGICVASAGGGAGSPLGSGGDAAPVIQGGGGGVRFAGCIGGGGVGGPGGTSLGGADASGIQKLSSGNLYDKNVIGRFPGDIISGGGGGCLPGTGGIGGGAGGVGPNAGVCSGITGGYFGGGSGGLLAGGNGGVAGGGGGSGYGAYSAVSFAHGTGLMVRCYMIPSALQSLAGNTTVGVGYTNTSLCIMGAGCSCTSANNITLWRACSTDGNYYYCDSACHTITGVLSNNFMKNWTGINTARCIIQNGNIIHYLYLDSQTVCCACSTCSPCYSAALPILRGQIICLSSNSSAPVTGANICGSATAPFYEIHSYCSQCMSGPCLGCFNGQYNWAYIPCKSEIFVFDGICVAACNNCFTSFWRSYSLSNTGTTCICAGGASCLTCIMKMATCNTYDGGFGCNNCGQIFFCLGGISTSCSMTCLGGAACCNSTIPNIGHKFRCHLYVPNCSTACSFILTGCLPTSCTLGIGLNNLGQHALIMGMYGTAERACVPYSVGCNFNAISTILVNAKCQIGCIPDACPDVYYYSADCSCMHRAGFGCRMYGLSTDPLCWCYNQASCWTNNAIHPGTLTYWPQANVFVAFSSCTDTYAYSNTLEGNWTFATHCAVKCGGLYFWCHCDLQCSFLHPHRSTRTPPMAIANNRIAIKYYNCAVGACCSGILVSNNIACSNCWVAISCPSQAGWCNACPNLHYVPYLDRIVALHGCCIHVSSTSNQAVSFTSCNVGTIAASNWCSYGGGWSCTAFLYNKYGDSVTHTCRPFGEVGYNGVNFAVIDMCVGSCCPIQCGFMCYGANNIAILGWNPSCCTAGIAMSCDGTNWATGVGCYYGFAGIVDCFTACRVACNLQVVGSANNTIIAGKYCNYGCYMHFDGSTICLVSYSGNALSLWPNCQLPIIYHNNAFLAYTRFNGSCCQIATWTCNPRNPTWACPSFFNCGYTSYIGDNNIICTRNCSNQTCFVFLKAISCTNTGMIARSADLCTWNAQCSISSQCFSGASSIYVDCYHYDPCYDLFFWATPGNLVMFNNDLTSVCNTCGTHSFKLIGTTTTAISQTSIANAICGANMQACFGEMAYGGDDCVYNISGCYGPGGITYQCVETAMIPKCNFSNPTCPVYCFDGIPGPMLVVSYCTGTKCFTLCNYPIGWTDLPYCGTYCSSNNYIGTPGCGGQGLVVVEY